MLLLILIHILNLTLISNSIKEPEPDKHVNVIDMAIKKSNAMNA